ncbi:MAG: hypothetical protein LWW95_05800 [Candidatus Desulfofervidus auxilii]|nr:hypothetical protein [Candidatus Desulfofervidus auxilii]
MSATDQKLFEQQVQHGIRLGLLTAIKLGLESKFGTEGLKIYPEIKKIEDINLLETINEAIKSIETVEEIKKFINK